MSAILVASIGAAALTVSPLDTTVTVGNEHWFDLGTEDSYYAYGFNDTLADPLGLNTMGSMGASTYTDGSATLRTINTIYYSENTPTAAALDDSIFFGLAGVSIPNTDQTFKEIVYNGVTYVRASATTYTASVSGQTTFWQWNNVSPNGPTNGVRTFLVNL